jgi:beta-galactosidase
LVDENGILKPLADRTVSVKVEGAGTLQDFGSANPQTEENYFHTEYTTYDGKALAVVRPTESGTITVTRKVPGTFFNP